MAGVVPHPRILARPLSHARLRLPPKHRARHGPTTEPPVDFPHDTPLRPGQPAAALRLRARP